MHDVERVKADGGLWQLGAGGPGVGLADVHAHRCDGGQRRIWLLCIEVGQGLFAAPGLDVDDGAGVVIADDGQVAMGVAVADFIDTDAVKGAQSAGGE